MPRAHVPAVHPSTAGRAWLIKRMRTACLFGGRGGWKRVRHGKSIEGEAQSKRNKDKRKRAVSMSNAQVPTTSSAAQFEIKFHVLERMPKELQYSRISKFQPTLPVIPEADDEADIPDGDKE
ncbi:hypothetical protein FVE85_5765 [Porphyridium purpureum]|uniref:Uncharacterized protein n=1 Tax=Porphyridium purpureum TaxID=35688 RepID=A0A5J4Z4H6_PORPP|nr:hypothetical protein FVE85_5765 [Porphyridium purpureum]|eukprot:POR3425..scf295_1